MVLQRFAAHAMSGLRGGDLFGRLGGEEFVFVLADTDMGRATRVIERVRAGLNAAVADLDLPIALTASFGIAELDDRLADFAMLAMRADHALYGAKDDGRDRIHVAPPSPRMPAEPRFLRAWSRVAAGDPAGEAAPQQGADRR